MFQGTLFKRTMFLVIGALLASTILTMVAFILAGKNATIELETMDSIKKSQYIFSYINDNPESLEDELFVHYFFDIGAAADRDCYIFDIYGNALLSTEKTTRLLSKSQTNKGLDFVKNTIIPEASNDTIYYKVIDTEDKDTKLLVVMSYITYQGQPAFFITMSTINEYNSLVNQFVNILLLSTLIAAFVMLIPAYIMVRRIVLPIQDINEVAMAYGQGDFSVRADESHAGEVGELGASFNFLADRLSKSINDLTNERNRLEDIFNVIAEGIVVVDENGKPIVVNNVANTIFARAHRDNMFTERLQLIPFDEIWDDIDGCIASGEKQERTIEGPNYSYLSTIIPKFEIDNPDKCIGATAFFRDIYDEQKLERTRRDYVANISHELRTPLQTLRGLIEPLADGMVKKEEDKIRYYNIILNETLRLSRLIDDMLELSKLQSRTLAFKTYPFDLNQLLSDIETKFRPIMKENNIKFKVRFNSGMLPTVIGNPDRVEQVLVILLDNAKKYTPSGKSITIISDYFESEGKVHISVEDTGQGIHEYDINHIFDRFFKADRARGKKGTGLGLAIAKELLTYMGEDITVKSKYGEGTTFTFTLSKAEANNAWY